MYIIFRFSWQVSYEQQIKQIPFIFLLHSHLVKIDFFSPSNELPFIIFANVKTGPCYYIGFTLNACFMYHVSSKNSTCKMIFKIIKFNDKNLYRNIFFSFFQQMGVDRQLSRFSRIMENAK